MTKSDSTTLFLVIFFFISFLLYVTILKNYFEILPFIMFLLIVILIYLLLTKDAFKSKYYSPKIIGNGINSSYMHTKVISIDSIIPNNIAIPLEGYFDNTFGEVTGNGGVLIVDKSFLYKYDTKTLIVHPQIKIKFFSFQNKSKYNELIRLFEAKGFNINIIKIAVPQNLDSFDSQFDLTSTNFSSYVTSLISENARLKKDNEELLKDFEDQLQKYDNISESKRRWLRGTPKQPQPQTDE